MRILNSLGGTLYLRRERNKFCCQVERKTIVGNYDSYYAWAYLAQMIDH